MNCLRVTLGQLLAASHAGVAPERGTSSTMILALADLNWFGKVVKGKRQGTSNVGPVAGRGRPARDAPMWLPTICTCPCPTARPV